MIRPLRDQIIVRPLEWRPSSIIAIAGNKRAPLRGVVVAVGPARRVYKYWKNSQGQRVKMGETGQTIPTEVKPGDVVELGGLELDGYKFQTIDMDGKQHVICREQDVCFVHEQAAVLPAFGTLEWHRWQRQFIEDGYVVIQKNMAKASEAGNGQQEPAASS